MEHGAGRPQRVARDLRPRRRRRRDASRSRWSASTSRSRTPTSRSSESLDHAGFLHGAKVEIDWVDSESLVDEAAAAERLAGADGILIPGGFGGRGIEGKILAAQVARERRIPYLGICLGMQIAVSEFARNVAGMDGRQLDRVRPRDAVPGHRPAARAEGGRRPRRHDAPGRRPDQAARRTRARGRSTTTRASSTSATATATRSTSACGPKLEAAGLVASGTSPDDRLVEVVELPGPPVLRRLPVPPGVQVAARAPGAAVPGVRGRRAASAAAAASGPSDRSSAPADASRN